MTHPHTEVDTRDPQSTAAAFKWFTVALVLLAVGGIAAGLMLVRVTNAIVEERDRTRYERCLAAIAFIDEYNAQQQALADHATSPELVDIYVNGKIEMPDCEALKPAQ